MRTLAASMAVALVAVTGCTGGDPAAPIDSGSPSFSVTVSGDRVASARGLSLTQFLPNGWGEQSGPTKYTSDVTLMAFADLDVTRPQTNLGLLGLPRVGTYRVRVLGGPFGTTPEFYANYRVRNADGTSTEYTASTGTITLTSVSPVIRGTFAFHASRATVWPATMTVGLTVASQPASLDVAGQFVARAP